VVVSNRNRDHANFLLSGSFALGRHLFSGTLVEEKVPSMLMWFWFAAARQVVFGQADGHPQSRIRPGYELSVCCCVSQAPVAGPVLGNHFDFHRICQWWRGSPG
jgi:hypothetical protein